ncbi:MAG: histidine kinase [Bacteroidia bacterium]|nr:histidine kinase [Bacteroidia bacterium]
MKLRAFYVGDAPSSDPRAPRIPSLPDSPEPFTVYLLPSKGTSLMKLYPCLIYNPKKATKYPDQYYDPKEVSYAQLLLAWKTYVLRKWCKRKWRISLLEKAPSIYYFAFDEKLRLIDYNPALKSAVKLLRGTSPRRGQAVMDLILPSNREAFQEELRLLREGHALQVQRPIGSRYAEICLIPLRPAEEGRGIYGYYALDTTLYRQLIESTISQQALQENILSHLREGILVLDKERKITYLNPAAESMLGGTTVGWLGQSLPFPSTQKAFFYQKRLLLPTYVTLDEKGETLLVLRDISDLWQAEKLSQLFRTAVEEGVFGLLIFQIRDQKVENLFHNTTAHRWLQLPRSDYVEVLQSFLPKREKLRFQKVLQTGETAEFLLRAAYARYGWSHLHCSIFPVQIEEPTGLAAYWLCVLHNQTEIYRALRKQNELERRQNQLILEALEKERQHLAEELHDNVGMLLSVLKMEFSALVPLISSDESLKGRLAALSQRLDEVTQLVRLTSHQLMPPLVEHFGLLPSLEGLIRRVSLTSPVQITLEVVGDEVQLPFMKVIQLYRILQELINNTLKHAGARKLYISLHYQKKNLLIEVWDDGKGYSPHSLQGGGIGLRNILGRIQVLRARWENLSSPGKGAHYRIDVPLPRKKY